jgi:methionyl-tRNA formyltransferase
MQIHDAKVVAAENGEYEPGAVVQAQRRLIVACGEDALEIETVEPAGRRAMAASAYLNGVRAPIVRLGDAGAPEPVPPLIVPVET